MKKATLGLFLCLCAVLSASDVSHQKEYTSSEISSPSNVMRSYSVEYDHTQVETAWVHDEIYLSSGEIHRPYWFKAFYTCPGKIANCYPDKINLQLDIEMYYGELAESPMTLVARHDQMMFQGPNMARNWRHLGKDLIGKQHDLYSLTVALPPSKFHELFGSAAMNWVQLIVGDMDFVLQGTQVQNLKDLEATYQSKQFAFMDPVRYGRCMGCQRDSRGRIKRDPYARQQFMYFHPCPATGKSFGACPGYVVDHVVPLACGGQDHPSNMQWQTVDAGKAKDRTELRCK